MEADGGCWADHRRDLARRSDMSMCIPWSMTTPVWPTPKSSTLETAEACAGFMLRAAHWFSTWGYRIDRVMTDNALAYRRSKDFAEALAKIKATHKLIRPYRPQTNGKVERFHQTLLRGWAYKQPYLTNQQRRQALKDFLHTYNHHRPHSSLGSQPPITKLVTHLCGKDN